VAIVGIRPRHFHIEEQPVKDHCPQPNVECIFYARSDYLPLGRVDPVAATIAAVAAGASVTVPSCGNENETGRSLRGGKMRSRQRRRAVPSPSFAFSTAIRVIASASPSSIAWLTPIYSEICRGEDRKLPTARIGDFVDLAQNSSQDNLSLQQAGSSRAPPLNASTA
jgi:hypothetical protein